MSTLRIFVREAGIWLTHWLEIQHVDYPSPGLIVSDTCALCAEQGHRYQTRKNITSTAQEAEREAHEKCTHTPEEIAAFLERRAAQMAECSKQKALRT